MTKETNDSTAANPSSEVEAAPSRQARLLRRLLFIVFIYAGLAYGGSLLEYTTFNLTGKSPVAAETLPELSTEALKQEFIRCGAPLFAANSTTTENIGDPILVRCGRFWPFYRYSLTVPAHPLIPGAFIQGVEATEDGQGTQEQFIRNMQIVQAGFALVSLLIVGLACLAIYQFFAQRDEEKGYQIAFKSFVGSLFMLACYAGVMFWLDPTFGYGW